MFLSSLFLKAECYVIMLLVAVAVFGDYMVSHAKLRLYKAVFDNATHGMIGGISWLIVCLHHKNHYTSETLVEIIVCTIIASLIDLDHFFAAKSVHLADAVVLTHRPPLHSSTIPLIFSVALAGFSYYLQEKRAQKFALIVFTAFASHHTRDATRRGFWFAPFGSTRPIPYFAYIMGTVSLPYLVCALMKYVKIDKVYQYTSVNV